MLKVSLTTLILAKTNAKCIFFNKKVSILICIHCSMFYICDYASYILIHYYLYAIKFIFFLFLVQPPSSLMEPQGIQVSFDTLDRLLD